MNWSAKIYDKLGIGILDRYIMRKFLSTFLYSVLLFSLIAVFIDISEKIDDFIKRKPPLEVLVFDYYIWFLPYFMGLFSPVFLFLSVIFFNSKLAQNTEIISILNSGAEYKRFLKPYLLTAFLLFVSFLWLNTYFLPLCDRYRLKFEDDWIHEKKVTENDNIYSMLNDTNVIHMQSFNYRDSVGFNCTVESFKQNKIYSRIFATRIVWNREKQQWRFEGFQQRSFVNDDEPVRKLAMLDTSLRIKPDEFILKANYVSSMTNPELNEYIRKEHEKGAPVHKFKVELYKRIAVPCSFFVLTLLGVSVSSRKNRGGTGFHLGIGIGITFVYLLIIQIFTTMGNGGVMAPWLAVWTPPVVFFFIALYLLKIAPK